MCKPHSQYCVALFPQSLAQYVSRTPVNYVTKAVALNTYRMYQRYIGAMVKTQMPIPNMGVTQTWSAVYLCTRTNGNSTDFILNKQIFDNCLGYQLTTKKMFRDTFFKITHVIVRPTKGSRTAIINYFNVLQLKSQLKFKI